MATEDLLASIQLYQAQLEQIDGALASASSTDKAQLLELQENLLQLLDLTLQQLKQNPKTEEDKQEQQTVEEIDNRDSQVKEDSSPSSLDKKLDDEFALFQSEIAELEESSSDEAPVESKYSKEVLEALEGTNCRSPFTEKWGGHSYHNAVVLSVVTQENGDIDLVNPQVRVLYSQPTSLEMLTCRFFLSGRCKYSDDACRFSHGKIVAVSDLKDYREPEYDSIQTGSRVLFLLEGGDLWTTATVQDILEDRSAFCVQYDRNKVAEVKPAQMVPLHCEDDKEDETPDDEVLSDNEESDNETTIFIPTANWLQHSMTQRFGDWEKHTKGIGSKLMEKMGYIIGTGLGPLGEGRVEPVTAYVYPQGVSLDRCMELREASNGEELLQVEKRLDREKRKEEAKSAQAAERLRKRTSVFDIINKKLGGRGSTPGGAAVDDEDDDEEGTAKPKMNVSRSVLQKDTTKDLNRKNYQLSENIRLVQRDIAKIEETRERQSSNKAALKIVDDRLQSKKNELHRLQEAERKVQGEQQKRKDSKKFSVF